MGKLKSFLTNCLHQHDHSISSSLSATSNALVSVTIRRTAGKRINKKLMKTSKSLSQTLAIRRRACKITAGAFSTTSLSTLRVVYVVCAQNYFAANFAKILLHRIFRVRRFISFLSIVIAFGCGWSPCFPGVPGNDTGNGTFECGRCPETARPRAWARPV